LYAIQANLKVQHKEHLDSNAISNPGLSFDISDRP